MFGSPVAENVAAVADRISNVHDQWHDVVLGKPVRYITGQKPLADIATELALPGGTWFTGIKRLLQVRRPTKTVGDQLFGRRVVLRRRQVRISASVVVSRWSA